MSLLRYNEKLSSKELNLRILPPKELERKIQAIPKKEIRDYGKSYVPYGLINMVRGRITEINQENLNEYERGRLSLVEGKIVEAEAAFELALKSGDERVYGNLGKIKELQGDISKAIEFYEHGKDSSSKNSLGNYLRNQKDHDKAGESYREALRLSLEEKNPNYGAILINVGLGHVAIGETKAGVALFQKATQHGYYEGYMEAYKVAVENGYWHDVRFILMQASQQSYGPAIIQSAIILLEQGQEKKSQDMFKLAEELGYTLSDEQKKIILSIRFIAKNVLDPS